MNKFRNKLKGSDGPSTSTDALNILNTPAPVSPGLKKSATSRWKKNKKQPEAKPELNIIEALPSHDNFRTSLLMPNLSARFSMLREQDDPNSLLGKASDDSVLQPRRRSRMADFGFGSNGLNDIAEVQSTRSSIKPSFHFGRQDSCDTQGYGSEGDSNSGGVMGRARPGEGNVMFGGRQKVYKIATGNPSSSGLGKAVYEDDIGMSAFQRYRKEREAVEDWQMEDEPSFDFGLDTTDVSAGAQEDTQSRTPNDSAKDLSHSPSLSSYDKKRSTTSSMAHSEARSSTAATSVASQQAPSTSSPMVAASQGPSPAVIAPSLKRSDTKTRRLYEQGLDQHIQEQQTSAMTRLNSLHRPRPLNNGVQPPPFLYTKSATNLGEVKTQQQLFALRSNSPPPSMAPLTTFGSLRKPNSNTGSPLTSGPQSPVSPQIMEFPELTQALEPGDRGKATAMGAFNKPKQSFDENQYLERQQQLQRSLSRKNSRKAPSASAEHQRAARLEQVERERSVSGSSVQQRAGRLEQADRNRSNSNLSTRSRSRSASKGHEPTKAYNVFQNAANSMAVKSGGAPQYDTHRTFFGNISASDSEEEEDAMQQDVYHPQHSFGYGDHGSNRWQPASLAPVSEHPAFRGHASKPSLVEEEEEDEDMEPSLKPSPSSRTLQVDSEDLPPSTNSEFDSPTLGPSTSQPLNGMVHHLRQASTNSSVYPMDDPPEMPSSFWNSTGSGRDAVQSTIETESRVESTYTNSNPWDLDDSDVRYSTLDPHEEGLVSPIDSMRQESCMGSRAPSRMTAQMDRQSKVSQDSESVAGQPWQHELRKQHTREASTATQADRDAFDNELAARRNAVQENLKSIVENQSRGASPAPSTNGAFKAFGMLRSKSSRESVDMGRGGTSAPTKAMKMLGIGSSNANASNATLNSQYERTGYSFDATRPRGNSGNRGPPMPPPQRAPPGLPYGEWDQQSRPRAESNSRAAGQSPASTQASRARSRSNSEATTGRSRSRTGPYRDDLEKAMIEGTGSSAAGVPELSPMITRELTPRPSPDMTSSPFDSQGRSRSNSRPSPAMTNYFDAKMGPPSSVPPTPRLATGASPATYTPTGLSPAPTTYTPTGYNPNHTRPSPGAFPIAQNPTPPISGHNTPQAANFPTTIQPRQGMLRKRNVSKFDISEPTLISATSNVDTVDLPEGASLKNGMDSAPPLPPINPKRRGARKIFGMGRSDMSDDAQNYGNYGRSKTPDPWMSRSTTEPDFEAARSPRGFHHAKQQRPGLMPQHGFENHSSPAIPQYGGFTPDPTSPERRVRSPVPQQHATMDGGMF
ncbi:hypothetical protein LTR86_009356 [Recurvomyces mirabilis]|nr:hypothetical protein LTR86_009356 [Recurvomyces mirabilis]